MTPGPQGPLAASAVAQTDVVRGCWFRYKPPGPRRTVCKEYDVPYSDGQYLCTIPPRTFFGPVHEVAIIHVDLYGTFYTVVLVLSATDSDLLIWVNVSKGQAHVAEMVDISLWIAKVGVTGIAQRRRLAHSCISVIAVSAVSALSPHQLAGSQCIVQ